LVLTRNNTYTGATTISVATASAGTLIVSSARSTNSAVTVNSGGMLARRAGGHDHHQRRGHFRAGRDRHRGTMTVAGNLAFQSVSMSEHAKSICHKCRSLVHPG
jgi:hypothetical protein